MALALKEDLHRLVDAIPDSDSQSMRVICEAILRVLAEQSSLLDDVAVRGLRDFAEAYLRETAESGVTLDDWLEQVGRTGRLRGVRVNDPREDTASLPRVLADAPEDDEPLTPEEAAMLDARLSALASGSAQTFSHEEVGRMLDEAGRTLKE